MTQTSAAFLRLSVTAILGGAVLLWSGHLPRASTSSLLSAAQAQNAPSSAPKSPADSTKQAPAAASSGAGAPKAAPVCKDEMDEYGQPKKVCR